jgi:hypothetical protein
VGKFEGFESDGDRTLLGPAPRHQAGKFSVAGLTEIFAGGISGEHSGIGPRIFLDSQQKILDGTFGLGLQVVAIIVIFSRTIDGLISCEKSR